MHYISRIEIEIIPTKDKLKIKKIKLFRSHHKGRASADAINKLTFKNYKYSNLKITKTRKMCRMVTYLKQEDREATVKKLVI